MNSFSIASHTVHLWLAELSFFENKEQALLALLNPDENKRANRLQQRPHRQRFIITRGLLRKILSLYTHIPAQEIEFVYGEHGKPSLGVNHQHIQFNISHSGSMAIFALTIQQEVGVDIQKIETGFREKVAMRLMSKNEYQQLMELTGSARDRGFYQIWTKKEAVIKAAGEGLFEPWEDFSVDLSQQKQRLIHPLFNYYLERLDVPTGYEAALATSHPLKDIIYKQCQELSF